MSLFQSFLSTKTIGIDVGTSAIKCLIGTLKKKQFLVESFFSLPIDNDLHDDRSVKNPDVLGQKIAEALSQLTNKKLACSSALKGANVLTKRVTIPKISKKEIPDQVRWEAEQVFTQNIENITVDYILLGESAQLPGAPAGTPGWDLLLVGVRTDYSEQIQSLFHLNQVELKCLDIDAFCVGDFLEKAMDLSSDLPIAFVDIGASGTRVSVRHKGNIVFIREFAIGGRHFTQSIAQSLGLAFEDAEALKLGGAASFPENAQVALRPEFVAWKNELQQCEDVYVSQESNAMIEKWFFFGGAMMTPGLMESLKGERIANKIKILPAHELLVPAPKAKFNPNELKQWSARLITAAGLCGRVN